MIDFPINNIKILLPEIFVTFSTLSILILSLFNKRLEKLTDIMCIIVLFIAMAIIIGDINFHNEIINEFFRSSKYINYAKVILISSTILILFLSSNHSRYKKLCFEFPVLTMFCLLGMMLMVSSNDFTSMYLGFELQSLCLYALTAFDRDDSDSSEAGIKYFVLGAIASGILLFGISLIYGSTSSTNFSIINDYFNNLDSEISILALVGLVMIIIAIGFKISSAPFHIWTPDVYQGAPLIVTAFLSTVSKFAATFLMLKILFEVFGSVWINQWTQVIILMSALSMLIGAIGALKQESIKRILAYSSISHIGYILMGIASVNNSLMNYIFIYLVIYIIANIGLFSFLMNMSKGNDLSINHFKGLSKHCPISSMCLTILLFSLAGIPPLAGFFTKFYIFKIAIEKGLYVLCAIALISSVLSSFYYLKIIKLMYFEEQNDGIEYNINFSKTNMTIFALASLINLSFFGYIDKLNFN